MAKWFEKIPQAVLKKGIERGLIAVGIAIQGNAIARVPVQTGRLKGSLSYATKHHRGGSGADAISQPNSENSVWVGTNVEYAPYVEYGTRFNKAKPYLRPALDDNRKNAAKLLIQEIMKEYGR